MNIFKEFSTNPEIDFNFSDLLGEENYWMNLKTIKKLFEVICDGIVKTQSDSTTLTDMYFIIKDIKKAINEFSNGRVDKSLIINEFAIIEEYIKYDLINASYYLDPRFKGKGMSQMETDKCITKITELSLNNHNIILELYKWRHSDVLEVSVEFSWSIQKNITPLAWWEHFRRHLPVLYFVYQK